ncbi:hypothetical protein LRS06_21970 [Hymenobacter sp. J193]|uniref:hypothetical protein n=1 Tax=Hymenobacter sp. J193 TaxID=2898429 RepID=UPI0021519D57|nr:hypothetical protein [Hymenobacter sp. J193]MCR5890399.1 hypothetical protein [Hymenobacter sp. J193]
MDANSLLPAQQRWQLFSLLQGANLLLMAMLLANSLFLPSPLSYVLFTAHAIVWMAGIYLPSEKMCRYFWLNGLLPLIHIGIICLWLGTGRV